MEQEGTWEEYGTPGTTTLSMVDVEVAIVRLELFWLDTEFRAQYLDSTDCYAS
jgi:hypothetical protein